MTNRDCGVCCEKLNKSTRKEVVCVFCDYSICRSCFQKYTLETSLEAHCMNCKKSFTFDFITDCCTSVFVNKEFKAHRENILFDREKALLPETQPYVVIEHRKREIRKEISVLEEQRTELIQRNKLINRDISNLYNVIYELNHGTIQELVPEDRKKFVRKCPMENCRGFLSTQWKCGSCEVKICNKCNEEKTDTHECNPEHVASMELLNKDTKPCPNCGTMIHKWVGCSQIFCVDCHTAWDWNSCQIVTGVIHNPHYYEFINKNGGGGRNHGDIPCGGLPSVYELRDISRLYKNDSTFLMNVHQIITHIHNFEIDHYIEQDTVGLHRHLRVRYLMNEISENDFKTKLQQDEKQNQKRAAFRNILQMFIDVGSDIFRQILVYCRENKTEKCIQFVQENCAIFVNLIEYFNENMKKIGKMYKCVYPGITKKFHYATNLEMANQRNE